MKILAVDTSSINCSVAIVDIDDKNFSIINLKQSNDERTHSQKLMPLIKQAFDESNLSLDDISLLACCVGPGSFTGIRIGIATIKAFADSKNIPIVGITSLESLAYNESQNGYIIPLIDAKNNNVYSAIFSLSNNIYSLKSDNIADNINVVLNKLFQYSSSNFIFIGNGSIIHKDLIIEKFTNENISFSIYNLQSSISLAKCAYNKYKLGLYGDSNSLLPMYLKKSQAERLLNGKE